MAYQNSRLLRALRILFIPLANVLLKNRMTIVPVIEQLKIAYVMAARKNHGRQGKPASINSISSLTGMSRKHVAQLLRQSARGFAQAKSDYSPEGYVISAWVSTDEYISESGKPNILEKGPGPGSLHELTTRVVGKDLAEHVLERLLQSRSVHEHSDGRVELVERSFSISKDLPRIISGGLAPLVTTIDKNWSTPPGQGFGQHTATTHKLDPGKLLTVRRVSKARIIAFMEDIDDLLSNLETESSELARDPQGRDIETIGVGAYYFELERE